jgi:hypothetical protein
MSLGVAAPCFDQGERHADGWRDVQSEYEMFRLDQPNDANWNRYKQVRKQKEGRNETGYVRAMTNNGDMSVYIPADQSRVHPKVGLKEQLG